MLQKTNGGMKKKHHARNYDKTKNVTFDSVLSFFFWSNCNEPLEYIIFYPSNCNMIAANEQEPS